MSNSNNRTIVFASILAAILATGLLALNPSPIIISAGAQMYEEQYVYDNNNHPTKKSVNIQKINCVNSNINVNGIDITQIPQDSNALEATGNDATAAEAANTQQNGNGLADRINVERNLVNVCANVNSNDQTKVEPPEEELLATLSVSKTIDCTPGDTNSASAQACARLEVEITPNEYNILVSGNNPNPSSFDGSSVPVIVTLDPGNYLVSETADATVQITIDDIAGSFNVEITNAAAFSGDCDNGGAGTIAAGESQTCNIANTFTATIED